MTGSPSMLYPSTTNMCHLFLGLPLFALPIFWLLPISVAAPMYAVIVGFTAILYAYTWRVMRRPRVNGVEGMLGTVGRVVQTSDGRATLFLHGELWSAQSPGEALSSGDMTVTVGADGLNLRVRKIRATA